MKKTLLILIACLGLQQLVVAQTITGAGSSFIYPVLAKWANAYQQQTKTQINYQPIGSGGGLQQIKNRTVAFAASDEPLTMKELVAEKLLQFPMIVGGIVPVINLKGINSNQLTLTGPVLADIFLGKIKKWNDPQIVSLGDNKKLALPNRSIIIVHRADGSGTTFNFTNYLAKVSSTWRKTVGVNTAVKWPTGLGAKGNAGVASQVQKIPNTIGYVEYAYAKQTNLTTTTLQNRSGGIVAPNAASFAAAAKNANWQAKNRFYLILTNQTGKASWPIVATTFVLLPTDGKKTQTATLLKFFKWSYEHGSNMAAKLDYVAIPKSVYSKVNKHWQVMLKK